MQNRLHIKSGKCCAATKLTRKLRNEVTGWNWTFGIRVRGIK